MMRTTTVMTPGTQVLVPTHVAAPGTLQMAKIAPATTALPSQQTTVRPATTVTGGIPVGQPSLATKTILPQTTTLQQIQTQNVVLNPATIQQLQRTAEGSKKDLFYILANFMELSSTWHKVSIDVSSVVTKCRPPANFAS